MDISERIKAKRGELGLTQEDLAKKVGVSFQAISKWENGKSLPDIEILPVLSEVLNESIDFILTGREFAKKVEPKKDEIVAYFESFTKPYTLTESGVRTLRQAVRGYPLEKAKEGICIAFDTYGRNAGEIQKSQVSEMLSKLGGILYNESLPPIQRKIAQMVSSLSKRAYDYDKQASRRLKKDIADLLSWKTGAEDREDQQIGILNEINETHFLNAKSLWAAHYSIEEEIGELARRREAERKKREAEQRKAEWLKRIVGGYIRIDGECPPQLRERVIALNEEIKKGSDGIAPYMNAVVSDLALEMLGLAVVQDGFLAEALERKDFKSLAPKMYDYLGRYLGKDEHARIMQTVEDIDSIAAGDKKVTFAILDDFQSLLDSLLRKWLVLHNKKLRKNQEKPS